MYYSIWPMIVQKEQNQNDIPENGMCILDLIPNKLGIDGSIIIKIHSQF